MKLFLNDFTTTEKKLVFSDDAPWVTEILNSLDETTPLAKNEKKRLLQIKFTYRRVGDFFHLSGEYDTEIHLLCSRCAIFFNMPCQKRFSFLFTKNQTVDSNNCDLDVEASNLEDMIILTEDFIDLQAILNEQLQLQLPLQPLCQKDCKGLCPHCGTDLNHGRCACNKITANNPFGVLKDIKPQKNAK